MGPHGLATIVTTLGPPGHSTIDTSSHTSRFIVASSHAPGTQPTVMVFWATQLFIRSRHVASMTQS